MILSDDARRLAVSNPVVAEGKIAIGAVCAVCWVEGGHDSECPWLALPRIVAALEAAERLSRIVTQEQYHHTEDVRLTVDGKNTYSWCQSCDVSWPCRWSKAVEENAVLVAALRGEAVTG